jgi:hypothetical protein
MDRLPSGMMSRPRPKAAPESQDDFARHRTGAGCLTIPLMLIPKPTDHRSIILKDRREDLQARRDHERHQLRPRINEQIDEG